MAKRKRDAAALRKRRLRAAQLFEQGLSQAEVARRLGVSRVSAMRWRRSWEEAGRSGLESSGPLGRPSRLSDRQWSKIESILLRGPQALGYGTDLWTLGRVAEVILDKTGVTYHPGHVWRVLKGRGWSLQRPTTKARERDEQAILRWTKRDWPRLKKTPVPAE